MCIRDSGERAAGRQRAAAFVRSGDGLLARRVVALRIAGRLRTNAGHPPAVQRARTRRGPIKARRRGAGAGELLVGLAECMLAGGDFFTDLDPMRADVAGAQLRAVAEPPASTTAVGLGRRFGPDQLAGLRAAQAELIDRQVAALPRERRRDLLAVRPTIDLDPTDVEVYGEGKERIGWSYAGVRAGRPARTPA